MPGGSYVALSGMRSRLDQLDRLASDIANVGTAGYKTERTSQAEADRPVFDAALQSAIDVSAGDTRLDTTPGAINSTGRDLDLAIEGKGFFEVQTAAGVRYTRNGHFTRQTDGTLATADGGVVLGANGPLKVGPGKITVGDDGTVAADGAAAGKLLVVNFAAPGLLARETGSMLRADNLTAVPATDFTIRPGALEQANVSVVERISELTDVNRSFEALQKAVSVLMNDVDGRAIDTLGRH